MNPYDIFRASMDGAERGRERGLAQLMGKAYAAPREQRAGLLGQVAKLGAPEAAFKAETHFQSMDDNARKRFADYALAFQALPDEQKPMAYPQFAQQAQTLGIPAPAEWRPEFAPNIAKLAQALGGASGASVQSRFVGEDGMVYAMMRDGSLQSTGIKADRQMWLRDHPGMQPELVGKDGSARPVGMQAPQALPGVSLGQPMPFTIGDDIPPQVAAQIRAQEEAAGSTFAGPAPQQLPPQQDYAGGGYTPGAPRPAMTPAQASADQRAQSQLVLSQQAAQRDAERLRLAQEAAARSASKGSVADQKAVAEARKKMPQLQNAVRGIDRIQQALQGLSGGMVNTGPLDQYAQRFTKEGQELEAAVGAIQNSVLALTRVPGVGSQSDLEQRVAMLQYPSLDKAPEVNARTMQNLRLFLQDLQNAYQNVLGGQQDAPRSNAVNGGGWMIEVSE